MRGINSEDVTLCTSSGEVRSSKPPLPGSATPLPGSATPLLGSAPYPRPSDLPAAPPRPTGKAATAMENVATAMGKFPWSWRGYTVVAAIKVVARIKVVAAVKVFDVGEMVVAGKVGGCHRRSG